MPCQTVQYFNKLQSSLETCNHKKVFYLINDNRIETYELYALFSAAYKLFYRLHFGSL